MNRANRLHRWTHGLGAVCALALGFLLLAPQRLPSAQARAAQQNAPNRVRVAEGEYQIIETLNGGGVGPFAYMVYDFHETWTLWRRSDGTYDAEGQRNYESPKDEPHRGAFSVHLSHAFRILGLQEFRQLRWVPDSGPLTCDFSPSEIACASNAKDPAHNIKLDLPMHTDYGFLWPISAFSLGGITRSNDRNRTPVQLITVDEPNPEHPIYTSILDGEVQYLGNEQVTVAGQRWDAEKFELQVPTRPSFLIWTTPQGLLLAFAYEDEQKSLPGDGMRLVRFTQFTPF